MADTLRAAKQKPNRLRRWRLSEGLSEQDVADLTGLSVAMISRVERGLRQLAPLTKARVARCLGVPISALFDVEQIDGELVADGGPRAGP